MKLDAHLLSHIKCTSKFDFKFKFELLKLLKNGVENILQVIHGSITLGTGL